MSVLLPTVRYGILAVASAVMLMLPAPVVAQLQYETVKALAGNGSEGRNPIGPQAQAGDGWIYGLMTEPPPLGGLQLYRFNPSDPAGTFALVWSSGAVGVTSPSVGDGGLVAAGDGNLYFVDQGKHPGLPGCGGGASGWIGRVTPPGTVTPVFAGFCGSPDSPINPDPGLTVGLDGALYGTAAVYTGGASVYRWALDGTFSKVANFLGNVGTPNALTAGSDGWLYGTTISVYGAGQLYRADPASGVLQILHAFAAGPRGRLVEVPPLPGQDIAFVGVTERGGVHGNGQVYRVDVANGGATVATLHAFGGLPDDGNAPQAGLVWDGTGRLMGTTGGGPSGRVYRIGADGSGFAEVHDLGVTPAAGGVVSYAPLLLGSDGLLYGTTYLNSGGPPPAAAAGSLFRIRFITNHDLQVSVTGSGVGTVTSGDGGIGCPGDCTETYATGGATTLTAVAGVGSTFVGWSGDCSGTAPCVLAMNAAKSVTATFNVSGRDLVVTAVTAPPALAAPGGMYVVTDTTHNQGAVLAGASMTRFYLSVDTVKGAGDPRLTGSRAVPGLDAGISSTGGSSVTIPTSVAPGLYWQLACADDTNTVAESNEVNNCAVSATQMQVLRPNLVETTVGNPPAVLAPGTKFTATDTVQNVSAVTAAASTTRYYLSADAVKDGGDVLLGGTRSVPSLVAGASAQGSRVVTVQASTPLGTYRLLACADDTKKIAESDEGDNCTASAGTVMVAVPDLVVTQVSGLPVAVTAGQKITLTDTVGNQGQGPAGASTTRYYLSADPIWSAGDDVLLTGTRSVVALAPGAVSVGSKLVTVPLATPSGTYYALACADDLKKVAEGNEGNNCTASVGTVAVAP